MKTILFSLLFWLITELSMLILFFLIARWLSPKKSVDPSVDVRKIKISFSSWLKGFIERIFLSFLLIVGFEGAAIIYLEPSN